MTAPTTFNPSDKHADITLSGGNMTATNPSSLGGWGRMVRCSDFFSDYDFYAEFEIDSLASSTAYDSGNEVGFANANASLSYGMGHSDDGVGFYIDTDYGTYGAIKMCKNLAHYVIYEKTGPPAYVAGDVFQLAIKVATGDVWVGVNNQWVGNPAAGTGPSLTGWIGQTLTLACSCEDGGQFTLVTDPDLQNYSAPSGFIAKWGPVLEGDITGALGQEDATGVSREFHLGISAGLGQAAVPWKYFKALGTGDGEIDDNFISGDAELDGPVDAFRDRSPITGDIELGASFDMYRGHYGTLSPSPGVVLDASVDVELQYEAESVFVGSGFGAAIDAFNITSFLRENAGNIIRKYEFVLTGDQESPPVDDVTIPAFSVQARARSAAPSYLAVQVSYLYIDQVLARTNGQMKIYLIADVDGSEQIRELILSAGLDDIRPDRGGRSGTISLSGYKTETVDAQTITLQHVSKFGKSDGKITMTADIDFYLRPGHTVIAEGETFTAGLVTYFIGPRKQTMEVTEA